MTEPQICCGAQDPVIEEDPPFRTISCCSCGAEWTEEQLAQYNEWLRSQGLREVVP